jgi:DNA-binding NarL/FixJ family response regulator
MGGTFVLSDVKDLTSEEMTILRLMAKGKSGKEICDSIKASDSGLKRKKQTIYTKLDVNNSNGALHKARLLGII